MVDCGKLSWQLFGFIIKLFSVFALMHHRCCVYLFLAFFLFVPIFGSFDYCCFESDANFSVLGPFRKNLVSGSRFWNYGGLCSLCCAIGSVGKIKWEIQSGTLFILLLMSIFFHFYCFFFA